MAAAVINVLRDFGQKIDEFDQGARGDAHLAGGQVDDGFCRGVCTDWLRRLIQGGKPWYDPTKQGRSEQEVEQRREAQTLRMANIQLNTGGKAVPATTSQTRMRAVSSQLLQIYNSHLGLEELSIAADIMVSLQEFYNFQLSPNGRYNTGWISDIIDGLAASITPSDPNLSFGTVAAQLDGQFRQARLTAGRSQTKRPFSGITPTLTETPYISYQGLAAANTAIITAAGFNNGCGQIAAFQIHLANGSLSGHAVAIYRYGNDEYDLFDPNYGIFRYSRAGVGQAIDHLFGVVYQTNGDRVLVNGMCGMRRQVFRPT
ncbi:MAG TPA: YopT-type cysteine protease domain-containing protein [Bryobacteraceae bacterium]|nr:YopT-type cysteine protease domain-containing protein [Bryobacteraceae bacterium]